MVFVIVEKGRIHFTDDFLHRLRRSLGEPARLGDIAVGPAIEDEMRIRKELLQEIKIVREPVAQFVISDLLEAEPCRCWLRFQELSDKTVNQRIAELGRRDLVGPKPREVSACSGFPCV